MRIRTVYFKVRNLDRCLAFWSSLLKVEPTKKFPKWCEFRVGEINLGLLSLGDDESRAPSCVPVIELDDDEIQARIALAKDLGATAILEGEDHPDHPHIAAVLRDSCGNEFELTSYHG